MPAPPSAGILLYRRDAGALRVWLAHPGGPFWARRDEGSWTIPKGELEEGEDARAAALREFQEETGIHLTGPLHALGSVRQKAGKRVEAWACEDVAGRATSAVTRGRSTVRMEWPRGSGGIIEFPEVDRLEWFDLDEAKRRMNPAQAVFLDRLSALLQATPRQDAGT